MVYCRVAAILLAVSIFDILMADLAIDLAQSKMDSEGSGVTTYTDVMGLRAILA